MQGYLRALISTSLFLKFLKFGLVGFTGLLVDFVVTWLLKEKLKANKYLANSVGFALAASSNYVINRIWTFQNKSEAIGAQYASFLGIAIIGLGLNNLIIFLLQKKFKLNFYVAKLLAVGVVMLWNFFANYYVTFSVVK